VAAAPPPPPDEEVERRLAALKAGADPATLGPPRGPATGAAGADASPRGPATGAAGADASPRPADEPGALVGEVIEPGAGGGPRQEPPGAGGPGAAPPAGPGGRAVAWGISQAQAGRLGLWIGVALVGFGAYLVLAELVPAIATLGSLALAIGGGALVAWHLAGRAGTWALHVGAILAGFGALRLVADVAALPPAGWGTLGAGLGLLAIAALRAARRQGVGWQAWVGGALAVWGGWGVLGATIPGFPTLGDLIVPLVLVLLGVAVLRRGVR
jgi:hypothetical protein